MARVTIDGNTFVVEGSAHDLMQVLGKQVDRVELATADGTLILRPALATSILVEDDSPATGTRTRKRAT